MFDGDIIIIILCYTMLIFWRVHVMKPRNALESRQFDLDSSFRRILGRTGVGDVRLLVVFGPAVDGKSCASCGGRG